MSLSHGCLDESLWLLQNDGCEWRRTIDLRQHMLCPHASSTTGSSFPPLPVLTRLRRCILRPQASSILRIWKNERRPLTLHKESVRCTINGSSCQRRRRIFRDETYLRRLPELILGALVFLISYKRISLGTNCGVFVTWGCLLLHGRPS